ncbi:hypothetical protein JVU11DRAFT_6124 [Chiua virens]|nr:hypothetical protein JVU11DRAFT_6124 [Chiua virens]
MPQAPKLNVTRQESKEVQKAIDKEHKRNRGVMSCAECRRLKLKCDKTVPCSSCKRRGCSAICPNGKLTTGQGTRFVLADTEKLHEKILLMSDRIRQLEDALAVLQSSIAPSESHPLLRRDLLDVKSIIDLHVAIDDERDRKASESRADDDSQYIEAFGTLALRDDGAATFYGRSAGSESLLIGEAADPASSPAPPTSGGPNTSDLPGPVKHLSKTFPLAPVFSDAVDLNYLVQNHLPPWHRARQLCELYLSQAPWFFGAVTKKQLLEECLPLWYSEASDLLPPGSVAPSVHGSPLGGSAESQAKTSHELALLFVIFCFGALTDNSLPPAPDNEEANMYCHLARAALNLEPVLDRPPSVTTIQTLALLAIYQGLVSGENSIECTWGIFGLATKLAQSVTHKKADRDCARWQLSPSEVQKRRALFWELFITDGWQSLATGRLATFYLPFVDCELPNDPDSTIDDDGSVLPSFPAWKARFGYECVSAVIENAQTAKVPKYSTIIELDRKVRDMELPKYAQQQPLPGAGLAEAMKHYMPLNYRNFILVYIHRCFFAEAVSNNPTDPMQSQFAPSFLAGYRSACEILGNLYIQFNPIPSANSALLGTLDSRLLEFCDAGFYCDACVGYWDAIENDRCCHDGTAQINLFREASEYGGRAVKFLVCSVMLHRALADGTRTQPILQRLLQKAEQAYSTAKPSVIRDGDIFSPSTEPKPKDELSIFSGRINTVATKSSSSSSNVVVTPVQSASSDSPSPGGVAGHPSQPSMPRFTTLHPTLRDQWASFEGDLNTQLTNAQRDEFYTDADTHMASVEGYEAPDTPHHQPQHELEQPRLYPLTIPASESQSSAPYTSTVSAAPSYRSNPEGVRYDSVLSPQAPLHHPHEQHYLPQPPPAHAYHHYQSELHSTSSQSASQSQAYTYSSTGPRYDPPGATTGSTTTRHNNNNSHSVWTTMTPIIDRVLRMYIPFSTPTAPPRRRTSDSSPPPPYVRGPMSVSSSVPRNHWDAGEDYHRQDITHAAHPVAAYGQQSYSQYDRYGDYGYPRAVAEGPGLQQQQQQLHLQETWQSFGVYVGSPRPTS